MLNNSEVIGVDDRQVLYEQEMQQHDKDRQKKHFVVIFIRHFASLYNEKRSLNSNILLTIHIQIFKRAQRMQHRTIIPHNSYTVR